MSGSDSGASDRWAKVERSANGVADYGIAGAVRTYYLVYLPLGAAFLIAVGAFLAVPVFGLTPDDWPTYLGFGMSVAAVGVLAGGLVYAQKRVKPLVRPQRQSALIWLDRPERKVVRDQIFGKVPPADNHLPALRGIAVQIRQGLAMQLLLAPGYLLLCANQMLLAISRKGFLGFLWVWIPLALLFLSIFATVLWQFSRTEQFLAQTSKAEHHSPQMARSLQAAENIWRSIAREFGMPTSVEVAELLGSRKPNRSIASTLRNEGSIVGVMRGNSYRFPGFQFDADKAVVVPVMPKLIALARENGRSDEDLVFWLTSPSSFFHEQDRPVDHLREDDRVLAAARDQFEGTW